ncbi:MAG: hypothetical protein AAF497_19185 [Planctomycetota bacterium]
MVSESTRDVIERAKSIYESRRKQLKSDHLGKFVAIEPDSGEFFVEDSFDAAVKAARTAHPSSLTHTIRIGHEAAFHIGLMEQ